MASIKILDLRPVGSDLFCDSESYLAALTDEELTDTNGGLTFLSPATPSSYGCSIAVSGAVSWAASYIYGRFKK